MTATPPSLTQAVIPVHFARDGADYFQKAQAGANPLPPRAVRLQTGAFRSKRIRTGYDWCDAVFNGLAEGDCRYPDPFTLTKSSVTVVSTSLTYTAQALSTSTATSFDYSIHGLIRGSPVNTAWSGIAPSAAGDSFSWNANGTGTWTACSMGSADFFSRPNGVVMDLIPRLVGAVHTVKFFAFPLQPMTKAEINVAAPGGFTIVPANGLTAAAISWGGREFEIDSTSKGIRLVTLPWDSRCFDFTNSSLERGGINNDARVAWGGWVFWANGMAVGDKFDVVVSYLEEVIPASWTATVYAYPASMRSSDSPLRDKMVNTVKVMADEGAAAFSLVDNVVDVARKVWGVGKKIYNLWSGGGLFNPPSPNILMDPTAVAELAKPDHSDETKELKEDYDFPRRESVPMATPRQSVGPRTRNPADDDSLSTTSLKSSSSALVRK